MKLQRNNIQLEPTKERIHDSICYKIFKGETVRYAIIATIKKGKRLYDFALRGHNIELSYINPQTGELEDFETTYYA